MSALGTVFVVDDDLSVRNTMARSLRRRGFVVETFGGAEAFLSSVDAGRPGCLVLDIAMPGMSGLELQAVLLRRGWTLPIIFITGHGDIQASARALKSGAFEFLEKPYQPGVLIERIDAALRIDARQRTTR